MRGVVRLDGRSGAVRKGRWRAWGGSNGVSNGEIEHLVITFLIDGDGRIQKRYLGLEHSPDSIVSDLERKT